MHRQRWIWSSVWWIVVVSLAWGIDPVPPTLLKPVTPERAKQHLQFLASDELQGRSTLRPTIWVAARYIAEQFRRFGLEPFRDTSYFHLYELRRRYLAAVPVLQIHHTGGKTDTLTAGRRWRPYYFTAATTVDSLPVVFAGYGVSLPDSGYDDYAHVDVQGKAVLVLDGLPAPLRQRMSRREQRRYGVRYKVGLAERLGAKALLVVRIRRGRVRLGGFPWPLLSRNISRRAVPAVPAISISPVIVASLGKEAAESLIGNLDSLRSWQRRIDTTGMPYTTALTNVQLSLSVRDTVEKIVVPNVVGVLRGTLRPEEYVVIGAHYDHIGTGGTKTDTIYNGADDNGSGTTGLLLLAEAFAQQLKQPPLRSILFVAFSGEEMGLLGSRAFVNDSTVPVDRIVAMLNMDMISRNHPDTLHVGGVELAPTLRSILEEENRHLSRPFTLLYDIDAFMGRSDQASFIEKEIPSLFFFTGLHPDYHQVDDEIDKVNFEKLAHVARLVGRVLWQIVHSKASIPFGEL